MFMAMMYEEAHSERNSSLDARDEYCIIFVVHIPSLRYTTVFYANSDSSLGHEVHTGIENIVTCRHSGAIPH
jgi:hypothetical protein